MLLYVVAQRCPGEDLNLQCVRTPLLSWPTARSAMTPPKGFDALGHCGSVYQFRHPDIVHFPCSTSHLSESAFRHSLKAYLRGHGFGGLSSGWHVHFRCHGMLRW
jgi:hypothetical protein